jgi:hypothetical protein
MDFFETQPLFLHSSNSYAGNFISGRVFFQHIFIHQNVTFSIPDMIYRVSHSYSASNNFTNSFIATHYIGLYSLTGSTLTLFNSASGTISRSLSSSASRNSNYSTYAFSTLNVSTTSVLTPGDYWIGFRASVAGTIQVGAGGTSAADAANMKIAPLDCHSVGLVAAQLLCSGMPAFGSVFTAALPASVETSNLVQDSAYILNNIYILIA